MPEEKKPVPVPKKEPAAPPKGTPELIRGQPFAPNASVLLYMGFIVYYAILLFCLLDAPGVFICWLPSKAILLTYIIYDTEQFQRHNQKVFLKEATVSKCYIKFLLSFL